jgi:DNA-binding NtrC family response regulator
MAGEPPGKVLVVDQDPSLRTELDALLKGEFSVTCVSSALEAHDALPLGEFDVVIAGDELRGANGTGLVDYVAREFPDVMVILLSEEEEKQQTPMETIARVLSKPVDPKRLLSWVQNTVKLARMSRATKRLADAVRHLR